MIPSYLNCEKIINHNSSFFKKEEIIDDFEISNYSYRLSSYTDFIRPLMTNKVTAFELRGLSFVHDNKNNKTSCKRYLMMNKFFNLNQTEGWMYKDVYKKKIEYVQEKIDGSLIRFIKLPNGKVIAKTIKSFDSEQAKQAIKIYNENKNIKYFVDTTLMNNEVALFEYISPYNQIVVKYNKDELRLLAIRNETNGRYYHKNEIIYYSNLFNIPIANFCDNLTLDEYIEKAKTEQGKEGWVITFEDGQKVKIKTAWYLSLHRIMTSTIHRENEIIASILEDSVDDLIASFDENDIENRNKLSILASNVINYVFNSTDYIYEIVKEFNGNRKEFALKYKTNKWFSIIMKSIENQNYENINKLVIEKIKKDTYNLMDAKRFIEEDLLN